MKLHYTDRLRGDCFVGFVIIIVIYTLISIRAMIISWDMTSMCRWMMFFDFQIEVDFYVLYLHVGASLCFFVIGLLCLYVIFVSISLSMLR